MYQDIDDLIDRIQSATAIKYSSNNAEYAFLNASGTVNSSHWSEVRLSQLFYEKPPTDSLLEVEIRGIPPTGQVVPASVTVSASTVVGVPQWVRGFKFKAKNNESIITALNAVNLQNASHTLSSTTNVIVKYTLAAYEDSHQPIGMCSLWSVKMKKLKHELILTVEGPDEGKIRSCINIAAASGLIAAIVAAYATGGGLLQAAVGAFKMALVGCLASGFSVRIDDVSRWEEWCI